MAGPNSINIRCVLPSLAAASVQHGTSNNMASWPYDVQATHALAYPIGVTALVFGREENGLSEDELRRCSHACALPTGRLQPSMNLSHAVAVALSTCWELRLAALGLEGEELGIERLPGGCLGSRAWVAIDRAHMLYWILNTVS